ncbi:hypothetical protein KKJ06_10145 [Xenorhabdus bovienii]|uniref:Calcium-dependent cell adhesion molecule 1 membrane-binding domain-containing protein n=1 Tax=Xenorhabdus bovienii str. Intermedium TaxID=1379677 RepID=A0A077Q9N9_XENBV|nr:hypothetical protein [Xenorhabdus bovienii]MDE9453729.1 hypothetical protein [Xenorhabdus bovienii]MDE9555781.1 hypothetical protein [Xenorhabdus bovienii]CDH32982.1 hypothetical protein XBI1_2290036 [Xenorhabdus bovienii str. Intermedium]
MAGKSNIAFYRQPNFTISLNLIDTTDAKVGAYLMILDAEGINNAQVFSIKRGSEMEYEHIPSTACSNQLTCSIYIKKTGNGSYPLVGTFYLRYHPASGLVDITEVKISPGALLNLEVDRVDNTKFHFKLQAKQCNQAITSIS